MQAEKHTYKNPLTKDEVTCYPQEGWRYSSQGWDRIDVKLPKPPKKKKKGYGKK